MSDTPRTDEKVIDGHLKCEDGTTAVVEGGWVPAWFARDLERQLEEYRYAQIEHDHFGCPVAKTGIYAANERSTKEK